MAAATRTRKKPAAQQDLGLTIGEGVHLHLPFPIYIDQRALGSSDFSMLYADPASWWYASWWNPERRARMNRSAAQAFGSALDCLILEGDAAYKQAFTVEPESGADGWIRTPLEEKEALASIGVSTHGDYSAETRTRLLKQHGLAHRCWRLAHAKFVAAKKSKMQHITKDEDRRLRHMAKLVDTDPDLGPGLKAGMSQVSVFWRRTPTGPLLRARFDSIRADATIDLKTMGNWSGSAPEDATFDAIFKQEYDLQFAHYHEAREVLRRFVREGRVHAWSPSGEGRKLLAAETNQLQAIASEDRWRWIWIFYQVRSDNVGAERAPVLVPWWVWSDTDLPLMVDARAVIEKALANHADYSSRLGLTAGWSEIRPIRPLPVDRLKRLSWKRNQQP